MAAKIAGCAVIIGIDVHEQRLALAKELGATHTINAKQTDPVQAIMQICAEGVDYSMDTSGRPAVLRQAVDILAQLGTAAHVAGTPIGTEVTLDTNRLLFERTLTGVVEGNSIPQTFIPQLIELYKQGESGATIKPVIVF
jgi:aryl-alcohol dehydrogenase